MKRQGFTLVELVIVIIIVGILSIVAVPIYRSYTLKAIGSEGKALMGAIDSAQQVHHAEYGNFQALTKTTTDKKFGVDARANKFFREFTITTDATGGSNYWQATSVGVEGTKAKGLTVVGWGRDSSAGSGIEVYDADGTMIDSNVIYQ